MRHLNRHIHKDAKMPKNVFFLSIPDKYAKYLIVILTMLQILLQRAILENTTITQLPKMLVFDIRWPTAYDYNHS
jgi:hypothetical protein